MPFTCCRMQFGMASGRAPASSSPTSEGCRFRVGWPDHLGFSLTRRSRARLIVVLRERMAARSQPRTKGEQMRFMVMMFPAPTPKPVACPLKEGAIGRLQRAALAKKGIVLAGEGLHRTSKGVRIFASRTVNRVGERRAVRRAGRDHRQLSPWQVKSKHCRRGPAAASWRRAVAATAAAPTKKFADP
jgi:hypothetical protein